MRSEKGNFRISFTTTSKYVGLHFHKKRPAAKSHKSSGCKDAYVIDYLEAIVSFRNSNGVPSF